MNKRDLECKYNAIRTKKIDRDRYIDLSESLDKQITIDTYRYRIDSVERVLSYINYKLFKKETPENLDDLIVHCLNKLHGNIDSIELDLDGEEK